MSAHPAGHPLAVSGQSQLPAAGRLAKKVGKNIGSVLSFTELSVYRLLLDGYAFKGQHNAGSDRGRDGNSSACMVGILASAEKKPAQDDGCFKQ